MKKPHANNGLETDDLGQSATSLHQRLHPRVEADDTQDGDCDPNRRNNTIPEMAILRSQGRLAISARGLRGLQNNNSDQIDDGVLKDSDPSDSRPVVLALLDFLLRFHGFEEFLAERAGGDSELHVKEEEGAEAQGFVEGADGIDVAGDGVVVDLRQGDGGEDHGSECQADDLALFFWCAVA